MKKNIVAIVIAICLIISCTIINTACTDNVTDCAYVQFVPAVNGELVQYTSLMYAETQAHIYLYENEESKNNNDGFGENYLLKIVFKRGLGIDKEVDEKETILVDIEDWSSMDIRIKAEYYSPDKKVYLNGVDITSKADTALSSPPKEYSTALGSLWHDGVYYFEDFGLVKGNKSNYINKIEYK